MRYLLPLFGLVLAATASAQIDMNNIMSAHGAKAEDDNDPFVPNEFIGSFRMDVHHFTDNTENKDSPTVMHYWSSAEMVLMKTEMKDQKQKGGDMKMMTDLKGKWQYMLMTDEKGKKTAMKSRKKKMTVESTGKSINEPQVMMVDETRTIEGHECIKAVVKSDDGTWTGWVAQDIPSPFLDMARTMKAGDPRMMERMRLLKGFPLEYEWIDAKSKDRMVGNVHDLSVGKVDGKVFSLDGYEVMEMPAFGQ